MCNARGADVADSVLKCIVFGLTLWLVLKFLMFDRLPIWTPGATSVVLVVWLTAAINVLAAAPIAAAMYFYLRRGKSTGRSRAL
jgi:hypothetical protein